MRQQEQQQQKGAGRGDSWTLAMGALQDLASVARSVVEGKAEEKKG